jgi:hypothetical protein
VTSEKALRRVVPMTGEQRGAQDGLSLGLNSELVNWESKNGSNCNS